MRSLTVKYKDIISELGKAAPVKPNIAIILGSGLGDFASRVSILQSINTSDIKGYPASTVEGHKGKIIFAEHSGKKLLIFQGRIHFYEGYSIDESVLPIQIASSLGAKYCLLTNAAGGIKEDFSPGDLMLVSSFNGIALKKELTDLLHISSEEGKNRMLGFPSSTLNSALKASAVKNKIDLKEGVYWYSKGPMYETPAEIKYAEKFGADAVGMSTVHEAVFAVHKGLKTSVVSCITNYAAGISDKKLEHKEVTETADRVKETFSKLILTAIELI